MPGPKPETIDIEEMISRGRVVTHFQPIISLKDKKVVGTEALSRGISADSGNFIPPLDLVKAATEKHLELELDRLFRKTALETYQKVDPAAVIPLFLNVNPKILDSSDLELGWTNALVTSLGFESSQIAIEICEADIVDTEKLINFVDIYRRQGFIIAIDDYGTNHSNLERIVQIKPDIIKIPRELVDGVHNDFYKEAIIKSIIHLAKNVGVVTIAEGVESEHDVLKCHQMGIDLYQGFYFARPSDRRTHGYEVCREMIYKTLFKLSGHMQHHIKMERDQHLAFINTCRDILTHLDHANSADFSTILNAVELQRGEIDCLYLLNEEGRQTHKVDTAERTRPYHQHSLFQRIGDHSDHSGKDYYILSFYPEADIYISDKFVSYTSKNYCRTISAKFVNSAGEQHTLCIDFILHATSAGKQIRSAVS